MKDLKRKVTRLEEHIGVKVIPQGDTVQVVLGTRQHREAEVKRRQAELVEKYGPQALEGIEFVQIIDRFPDDGAQG